MTPCRGLTATWRVVVGELSALGRLAVFGANDILVPAPARAGRGVVVVQDCGHWNLLFHAEVLRGVGRVLCRTATLASSVGARQAA